MGEVIDLMKLGQLNLDWGIAVFCTMPGQELGDFTVRVTSRMEGENAIAVRFTDLPRDLARTIWRTAQNNKRVSLIWNEQLLSVRCLYHTAPPAKNGLYTFELFVEVFSNYSAATSKA